MKTGGIKRSQVNQMNETYPDKINKDSIQDFKLFTAVFTVLSTPSLCGRKLQQLPR